MFFDYLPGSHEILPSSALGGKASTPSRCSPTLSTRTVDREHPLVSLDSSNDEQGDDLHHDSNTLANVPVIEGEITTGTSNRGGKMVFMNGFGYLYMSTGKETIGWRCARRDENCPATIHTLKRTGEFTRWNGKFHCHASDCFETRKRDILAKIKARVLDEYVPIKIIVEEEYRKASLSTEEKLDMPLPVQIGTS